MKKAALYLHSSRIHFIFRITNHKVVRAEQAFGLFLIATLEVSVQVVGHDVFILRWKRVSERFNHGVSLQQRQISLFSGFPAEKGTKMRFVVALKQYPVTKNYT